MQLDYSLTTPEERIECVNQLLAKTPDEKLTSQYLTYMSNYILFTQDKNQTKLGEHIEDINLAKTINEKHCCYGYNEQSAFVRCRYDKQRVKDKKSADGDGNNACNDNGKDDNDGYDGANKDDGVKKTK